MAGIDPKAAARLAPIDELLRKVQHAHGLVEQFAVAARQGKEEPIAIPLRRAFGSLKLAFMGAGLDELSQLSGAMEIAATRGGSANRRIGILREGIGSMRHQLELEQRLVLSEQRAAAESSDKPT